MVELIELDWIKTIFHTQTINSISQYDMLVKNKQFLKLNKSYAASRYLQILQLCILVMPT